MNTGITALDYSALFIFPGVGTGCEFQFKLKFDRQSVTNLIQKDFGQRTSSTELAGNVGGCSLDENLPFSGCDMETNLSPNHVAFEKLVPGYEFVTLGG